MAFRSISRKSRSKASTLLICVACLYGRNGSAWAQTFSLDPLAPTSPAASAAKASSGGDEAIYCRPHGKIALDHDVVVYCPALEVDPAGVEITTNHHVFMIFTNSAISGKLTIRCQGDEATVPSPASSAGLCGQIGIYTPLNCGGKIEIDNRLAKDQQLESSGQQVTVTCGSAYELSAKVFAGNGSQAELTMAGLIQTGEKIELIPPHDEIVE